MAQSPTISVIVPVFNAARYVAVAIHSIINQTFRDFELLIIDDGSTDNSLEMVADAVKGDPRCRIVSRGNMGIVHTCNQGIEMARGEYIFRMDADDISMPQRFELQVAYLKSHPQCVAVGSRVLLIDPDGLPIVDIVNAFGHEEIDLLNIDHERGLGLVHPATGMRRDALIRVGGYRAQFEWAEDLDLFLRLGEIGKLANLDGVLLYYRQHLGSVGYHKRTTQRMRALAAVTEARTRRGLPLGTIQEFSEQSLAPVTIADVHRKWAWWALRGRNVGTARKHGFTAFRLEPFSAENLRLLACLLRGR